mgnify:CR=1 FL=1
MIPKIRVWDKIKKKMYCEDEIASIYFLTQVISIVEKNDFINFQDCIIMLSTRIKDKNKNEIYEGDILYEAGIGNGVVEIDMCNGAYLLHKDKKPEKTYFYENQERDIYFTVLGNEFENPELLEDGEIE